ncbi:hypothetical protein HOLleu_08562 [Holothuria leucospilota]|uniref:Uncharacterized protein n=1 Tax=Holothuria leucospilota TaxID=206669 RepID=A0A9Q1CJ47_HOLLE|nr:hypothetical protein HOLleu_08562 [Holothuria leucospilota]
MESPRIPHKLHHSPRQGKLAQPSNVTSVQEVLDIVHSQQSAKLRPSQTSQLKMGRLGQTVPLPAIQHASLPQRPSTSFGDRPNVRPENHFMPPSPDPLSRSFPPPVSSHKRNEALEGIRNGPQSIKHVANDKHFDDSFPRGEKITRPQTSYGRRRVPVHRAPAESNKIVIPTCPVTNEFRSSSSTGDSPDLDVEGDDRDEEILRICKSRRKGSKKKEKERCLSPVKGHLMRKSSVE